jgi:hypothetical protein
MMRKLLLPLLILFLVIAVAACTGQNKEPAPGTSGQTDDKYTVANLVKDFGSKLKEVSLLAPQDVVSKSMEENYGGLVSPELLAAWQRDPQNAPGRLVSSPWPERIEILNIVKLEEDIYEVRGNIIEVTSASQTGDNDAVTKKPTTLIVKKTPSGWLIDTVTLGSDAEDGSITYSNSQYGFTFNLPEGWKNYWIVTEQWEGTALAAEQSGQVVETGPIIKIRHPQWSESEPRQDIPLMIFTTDQWEALQREEFSVGAAPTPPGELGRNANYVFALPARYNYAFPTGYEEVEQILEGQPLQTN